MAQIAIPHIESFYPALFAGARIVIILAGAYIVTLLARRLLRGLHLYSVRMMTSRDSGSSVLELEKRANTITAILRTTAALLIWALAGTMALREIGFDVAPLLAGAGVFGLALGFGAQNLVRDVISGLFMLMENQLRLNDVAVINGTGGLVEEINLRTTVLRGQDGTVHVFPNGTITTLSNMTREFSHYVFDIGVAYKEDTDRVTEVMREVAEQLAGEEPYKDMILAPLEVLGVDKFADSAVIIKARFKTQPLKQWTVGREMNRRLKKKFHEVGIEIPFPHTSVYFGEASKPFRLQLDGATREELKALVREVLHEEPVRR